MNLRQGVAGIAFALCAAASPVLAQSQVRDPGSGYFNLGLQFQSSNRFFSSEGEVREGRTLEQLILSAYAEVGVIERWLMLSLSADLLRRNVLTDQGATTGLGDLRLGAWSEILESRWLRVLGGVQVGLPTGDEDPSAGIVDETNQLVARTLPTGDGEFDVEPTLLLSGDISATGYPLRHYWVAGGGYWIRTNGFSDAVSYRAELGTQLALPGWSWLWLTARVRGVQAFEEAEPGTGAGGGIGLGNGISYTLLGGEAQIRLPLGLGLGLGADGPIAGRGVLDAVAFRSTLSFEL